MCRWLAYIGAPILMADLIVKPRDNLIYQSLHSRTGFPTNGDGNGLGWYNKQPSPGLFRSIRPAWNDMNLLDLLSHIESPLFMSHVRASSLAAIQETNCHPFRYKQWLFLHNGQITQFKLVRRALLDEIAPEYYDNIQGSTDSEVMFHLALTYGLEKDVPSAIAEMVGVVESKGKEKGITRSLNMTLGISDGKRLWGFRYGSDGKGPTLYISPSIEMLYKLNPKLKGKFGDFAACVVSEPIGNFQGTWGEIPENSMLVIQNKEIKVSRFQPKFTVAKIV